MKGPEERLRWFAPQTPAELDASIRSMVVSGLRLLVACGVLAWLAVGPMTDWMEFATGRPVREKTAGLLVPLIFAYPVVSLACAGWLAWRRPVRGRTYRIDERAIRWGDKSKFWKSQRAVSVRRGEAGRPAEAILLNNAGRTTRIRLSDDPAVAGAAVALIREHLPEHDAATHGPIDRTAELPAWTIASLVVACALGLGLEVAFLRLARPEPAERIGDHAPPHGRQPLGAERVVLRRARLAES